MNIQIWILHYPCVYLYYYAFCAKSYSIDLHWHVVWLHVFLKKSKDEVATLLLISSRTVHRYVDRFWGDIIPQDHRNRPARLLTDFDELTLVNLVFTNPGIYLHELQHKLMMTTGTEIDCSTICWTLKKIVVHTYITQGASNNSLQYMWWNVKRKGYSRLKLLQLVKYW